MYITLGLYRYMEEFGIAEAKDMKKQSLVFLTMDCCKQKVAASQKREKKGYNEKAAR
jgi:hypothetical protein